VVVPLVFLYAKVVHARFYAARFAQGSEVLKVFGAPSHVRVAVSQVSVVHSGSAFDGVVGSAASGAQKVSLVGV